MSPEVGCDSTAQVTIKATIKATLGFRVRFRIRFSVWVSFMVRVSLSVIKLIEWLFYQCFILSCNCEAT